jgi:sugar/nucleoside kinase (ribokinase family)
MGVRCDWVSEDLLDANTTLVAQLEVPPGETQALIRRVRRHCGRCVLNLAPALPIDLALLPQIDLLVANEIEAATISADPMGIARRLRQGLVVTRGAAGASAFLADGSRLDLPALAIDPVDTTGAGDTFVGVLAAGSIWERASKPRCGGPLPPPALPASPAVLRPQCRGQRQLTRQWRACHPVRLGAPVLLKLG